MSTLQVRLFTAIVAGCLTAITVPAPVQAQEGGFCPCGFNTAVRTRSLSGTEMNCVSADVDVANLPPHGVYNKQNQFVATDRNKKGAITNTYRFLLYEQGLLPAADFGNVVRYGATCSVLKHGKRRTRMLEAAYILTAAEYAACASDLSAFAASVSATASNARLSASSIPSVRSEANDGMGRPSSLSASWP